MAYGLKASSCHPLRRGDATKKGSTPPKIAYASLFRIKNLAGKISDDDGTIDVGVRLPRTVEQIEDIPTRATNRIITI